MGDEDMAKKKKPAEKDDRDLGDAFDSITETKDTPGYQTALTIAGAIDGLEGIGEGKYVKVFSNYINNSTVPRLCPF